LSKLDSAARLSGTPKKRVAALQINCGAHAGRRRIGRMEYRNLAKRFRK
jgi:hypothetical protein